MAEQSLRNKTVIGVGWSAADAFLGQGVTFLIGIILARLLTPAEYGLIGIVTIFTSILTGIVDSGFSNAIIRKNDIKEDDYNTMFITNMLLSVVLFVFLYFLAPFIAVFFARPELTSLTRVMGLILIIQALSLVQVTKLTKAIDFKTKTKASLFSAIISGIIGVLMALMNFGVWARTRWLPAGLAGFPAEATPGTESPRLARCDTLPQTATTPTTGSRRRRPGAPWIGSIPGFRPEAPRFCAAATSSTAR